MSMMFNVFSIVRAKLWRAFLLALLLTTGAMFALPTPASAATSTVSCIGTSMHISTPGAANSFGSYQLFGTGPNLIPAPVGGNQNQGFPYAQDGTVTVSGPNNPNVWTGVTVQQADGVGYTLRDTIGDVTCPTPGGDITPPVLTLPSDITAEATSAAGAVVTFTASATDANPPSPTVTCAPPSGSTFALGATTVNCTATDAAGNTASGSFKVTVVDTTPPALTVPANITANATSPSGAVVTYTATATDLVDGAVTPTCQPASGTTFPIGDTTVTCTATDAHKNTSTATFTVHIRGAAEQLDTLLTSVTGVGPGTSLANKVTLIQSYVTANNTAAACDALTGFINEVNAQTGKKITPAQAASFISQAQAIEATLGC
jgi:HYR domain-containing protein